LKNVYERLAQQGILKRLTSFGELNQSITMGLMKKIHTDGLSAVIENMKEAHLDNDTMNKLIQALTHINHHIQTQSSVSLEQMQNQLGLYIFF
jgi:DNA-binding transcriptional regulator YhcF (GntR family)